jgi:hypothetical protein
METRAKMKNAIVTPSLSLPSAPPGQGWMAYDGGANL